MGRAHTVRPIPNPDTQTLYHVRDDEEEGVYEIKVKSVSQEKGPVTLV